MHPLPPIAAALFALGAVEGLAYWWMHPNSTAQALPVLVWHPQEGRVGAAGPPVARGVKSDAGDGGPETDCRTQSADPSALAPTPSVFQLFSFSAFTYTPLPELYAKAAPMLRCSGGQVFFANDSDDSVSLHLAFFEWDDTDTGSVLEAFRHLPEVCMGSIGMKLIATEPPQAYRVGDLTLSFDHTVFRDPGQDGRMDLPGSLVHSFRAVWVAGLDGTDASQGVLGNSLDQLRRIRINCALTRFRPTHARVIQGSVRGAPNSAAAWAAFETAMLRDLAVAKI